MLIDVAIRGDRNVIKRESGKILKYKELITKVRHMWNVKTEVIPVIRGATGTISKSLATYQESTKLRNCNTQPYLGLHTYCGKW